MTVYGARQEREGFRLGRGHLAGLIVLLALGALWLGLGGGKGSLVAGAGGPVLGGGGSGNGDGAPAAVVDPVAAAKKKSADVEVPDLDEVMDRTDSKLGEGGVSLPMLPPGTGEEDKTVSPYFYVAGGDPDTDRLPLEKTSAEVDIAGVIASVRIHQVFGNDGKDPIEAVYVFPMSTRAAVHGMRMKIGERTIEAWIDRKEEAKETYETAKAEGKVASLLEQERPNVFTMSVANIMPGAKIEVTVDYSELLTHESGVYEFVYPTVVGPRYGGGADPVADQWISNPYQHEGEKETYDFDIDVAMETGVDLVDVKSPSHDVDVKFTSKSSATVDLKEKGGGNKDFVLEYRLADDAIEADVLLTEKDGEKFFLLMMEPPPNPSSAETLGREYIFLLDVSGSMSGFPLDTAKKLMENLFLDLGPNDYFNMVTFAGGSWKLSNESLPATDENVEEALKKMDAFQGGGGTELMAGLTDAYSVKPVKGEKHVSRTVVVVTDGYVGVEAKAFKFIREKLSDANLFAFGIGSSVNRYLIEGMARAGYGEPFVVLDESKAMAAADRFKRYVEHPVLTDIEVEYDGFHAKEAAPAQIPDLLAERPLVLFGKYEGDPDGEIVVRGVSASGKFEKRIEVSKKDVKESSSPIRHLWVRKWVEMLEDQLCMLPGNEELETSIERLGLKYSLLTAFTSFVAVDTVKSNDTGKSTQVVQPLPLPQGVSDLAVGGFAAQSTAGPYKSKKGGKVSYASPAPPTKTPGGGSLEALLPETGKDDSHESKPVTAAKDEVEAAIEAALDGSSELKALKKTCSCGTVKLKVLAKFDSSGKLDHVTVSVLSSGSCACKSDLVDAVKKAIEKKLSGKKFSDAAGSSLIVPIVVEDL